MFEAGLVFNTNISSTDEAVDQKIVYLDNQRGGKIFCRHYWFPNIFRRKGQPTGILFYFHGLFLHSGVGGEVEMCEALANHNNFYVVAFDHAGHGRSASDEQRGNVQDWKWFINDAIAVVTHSVQKIREERNQNIPYFFLGNSLGGAIAIHTALHFQQMDEPKLFGGAILIAPAIYGNLMLSDFLIQTLKFIHNCGGGWLSIGPAADSSHFASQEDYEVFKNDKYCYSGRISLTMGNALLSLTEITQKLSSYVSFPYCLFHSVDDPVVQVRGSQELYKKSITPSGDKEYHEYSDKGHMVLCAEDAYPKIVKWFQQRSVLYWKCK